MPETTDKYHRIPVKSSSANAEIKTITISSSKGIKALIEIKENKSSIITYLFSTSKWTMAEAKKWVKKHRKSKKSMEDDIIKRTQIRLSKGKGRFNFFVPLQKELRNGRPLVKVLEDEKGNKFLLGEGSNTKRDREGERMSSRFIQKMQAQIVGKPVVVEHKTNVENSIGYISETVGDKVDDIDLFAATTALEPEYNKETGKGNKNVSMILEKAEHGTPLAYSVGGRITKAFKETDKATGQVTVVLDDGEVNHMGITVVPAAYVDPISVMTKSLNSKEIVDASDEEFDKEISHEEIRDKLRKLAEPMFSSDKYGHVSMWVEKVYSDYFIVHDYSESKYYKIEYEMVEDEPELIKDSKKEVVLEFVDVKSLGNFQELFDESFENKDKEIREIYREVVRMVKKGESKEAVSVFFGKEMKQICNSIGEEILMKINKSEGDVEMDFTEVLEDSVKKALAKVALEEEAKKTEKNEGLSMEGVIKAFGSVVAPQLEAMSKKIDDSNEGLISLLKKSGVEIDDSERKLSELTVGELTEKINDITTKSIVKAFDAKGLKIPDHLKKSDEKDKDGKDHDEKGKEQEDLEKKDEGEHPLSFLKDKTDFTKSDIAKALDHIDKIPPKVFKAMPEDEKSAIRSFVFAHQLGRGGSNR